MDAPELAACIDHTLLDPLAAASAVDQLCLDAVEWQFGHVCVSPTRVRLATALLEGTTVAVCSVVGFPSGAHLMESKAFEAAHAVAQGATEIDMVAPLGAVADGDWAAIEADVSAVVLASEPAVVKVILETSAFDSTTVRAAAEAAIAGGAAWVKTSTGYHPSGGATVADVRLLHEVAAGRALVKASGGIRSLADALALLEAGASRLGTSRGVALMGELAGS